MPLHIEVDGGGFHAKGAFVALDRAYVAVKVNSNFPGNPARGLPTIQGAVLLYDAVDGRLLAILDSMEITSKRTAAATLGEATLAADIIVTATSSHAPFLTRDCVRPRTFIAAIGADNPHKNELHPDLFVGTKVVVDSLEQAAVMGDLHHAIDAEITIFDSTGPAIQDVASAAAAYARCIGRLPVGQGVTDAPL